MNEIEKKINAYSYSRFSSERQKMNSSLERQLELSKKYVAEHPELVLVESFVDEAISGYSGEHIKKGDLRRFLNLVEEGKIERGSVLLIENIDRLSRLKPMDAFELFAKIIRAGIKVVTLQTGMEYTEESLNNNPGQLYIIVGSIQSANSESSRKSFMIGNAWENKRKKAVNGKAMTGKCPYWLELSKDKKTYNIRKDVASTIELIFQMKLQGKGNSTIVRTLNSRNDVWKPPVFGRNKTGGWRESYLQKIIHNKQVIGIYQPHKMEDGVRKPFGEPINLYPPIIDKKLFYQVKDLIEKNRKTAGQAGGQKGKMKNIFRYIAKCGFCGGTMYPLDKGNGTMYLHCDISRRLIENGKRCTAKQVLYRELEELFFKNFEEIDFNTIFPKDDALQLQINDLKAQQTTNDVLRLENSQRIDRLTNTMADEPNDFVRLQLAKKLAKYGDLDTQYFDKRKELDRKIKEMEALKQKSKTEEIAKIQSLYQLMINAKDEDERITMRTKINMELRNLINVIKIYSLQPPVNLVNTEDELVRLRSRLETLLQKPVDKVNDFDHYFSVKTAKLRIAELEERLSWQEKEYDEPEPGIIIKNNSKYLDKFTISFKGGKTIFRVVLANPPIDTNK